MLPIDLKNNFIVSETFAPVSRTASGNGTAIDLKDYVGQVLAVVDCGAKTAGTNPTADFTLEDSANNSSWAANTTALSAVFTQTTTVAALQTRNLDTRACRRYARLVFTIGGTVSPAFPCGAFFVGQKNVQ